MHSRLYHLQLTIHSVSKTL